MIYICPRCRWRGEVTRYYFKCPKCGTPLDVYYEREFSRDKLIGEGYGIVKYRGIIPEFRVYTSIGEGETPIVYNDPEEIYFLLEHLNPSGSFKDRGAALTLSYIKSYFGSGIELVEDSSGNAAISYTLYSALSGYRIHIFMPNNAPIGKKKLVEALGGVLHLSEDRDKAHIDALDYSDNYSRLYIGHLYSPFFILGLETIIYHIYRFLDRIEHIFIPFGSGTLYLGIYRALENLIENGLLNKRPSLYIVEAAGYSKISRILGLMDDGYSKYLDGIKVSHLPRREEVLNSIKKYNVKTFIVDDILAAKALKKLFKYGYIVEPTSAVGYAAYGLAQDEGYIRRGENSLIILTGNGLKMLDTIYEMFNLLK